IYLFPAAMLCITATAVMIANIPGANAYDNPAIDDTINITVDSSCTMGQTVLQGNESLNPGGTKVVGSSRIAAYCNDNEGYAIYAIGYTNGEYGNTNLVSTDGNHTIPTGTSGNNSYWNMKLTQGTATGTTSYLPTMVNEFTTNATIPNDYTKVAYRDSSTISQNQDPTETGSYFTSTYSAHIDTTQPSGIYNGQVQYVMVHPAGAPAPEKPPTMQETAKIKAKLVNVGDTMQATDTRDGKKYWITKLADGNIWMTQNLDLELNANKTYTPVDTDVSTNWTPISSTINFTGTTVDGWTVAKFAPYSASPGELYVYSSGTTITDSQYTSLAACQAEHPDCSAHNHVGNYYNWSAAVASNNTGTTAFKTRYNNAPDSICPAGWRLPIARDSVNTAASREWNALLLADGIMTSNPGSSYVTNGFNNIRISPLWLVRSGHIGNGSLEIGSSGNYWSSTVLSKDNVYQLAFYPSYISPDSDNNRGVGYSVRCLVK
ncbi:MAG: FISUMP domain-containing protein, partial [Candidatus Saccharimonadaceae bacterium]|nr:FISUMP domain-containing protein [Candidatus Saccharimonadaceae bacterium]